MLEPTATRNISIRPAYSDDLEALAQIWYRQEIEGDDNPPPFAGLPLFRHMFNEGSSTVLAEHEGRAVGFAMTVLRAPIAFLSKLFIDPAYQSQGIGQRLLQAVMPDTSYTFCTLSSTDRRAHALYLRAGMTPRWTHYILRAQTTRLASLQAYVQGIETVEAQPEDDAAIEQWDRTCSGRYRPQDLALWRAENEAVALWFKRHDAIVGYAIIRMRNDESLWYPLVPTIGPLGVDDPADASACVCAAIEWTRNRGDTLRLGLAGTHPAVPLLVRAGVSVIYPETFFCDRNAPQVDPVCYVPSGASLF